MAAATMSLLDFFILSFLSVARLAGLRRVVAWFLVVLVIPGRPTIAEKSHSTK
jgi:hypothetical protein